MHRLAGLDGDGRGLLAVTNLDRSTLEAVDVGSLQSATLPLHAQVIIAAGAQSGD